MNLSMLKIFHAIFSCQAIYIVFLFSLSINHGRLNTSKDTARQPQQREREAIGLKLSSKTVKMPYQKDFFLIILTFNKTPANQDYGQSHSTNLLARGTQQAWSSKRIQDDEPESDSQFCNRDPCLLMYHSIKSNTLK